MIVKSGLTRVVDGFPAFNETSLASFRIRYLAGEVEKVVIAEARLTQSGIPKPLYFKSWLVAQARDIQSRVSVIEVPLSQKSTNWEREIYTREYLFHHIQEHYSDFKFILSDLDEIPSIEQVIELKKSSGLFHFMTPTYYRKINWQLQDNHVYWAKGVMGDVKENVYRHAGRFERDIPNLDSTSGGHFSWFGLDNWALANKSKAAAHSELHQDFWNSQNLLRYCDYHRVDHLGRSREKGFGLFRILNPLPKGILLELSRYFPDLVDYGVGCPNRVHRFWASCKVSAYVGETTLAKLLRSKYSVDDYFARGGVKALIFVCIECIFAILGLLKRTLRRK